MVLGRHRLNGVLMNNKETSQEIAWLLANGYTIVRTEYVQIPGYTVVSLLKNDGTTSIRVAWDGI